MSAYLRGRLTAYEAAFVIGVHIRTVRRWTPRGWDWDAERANYVDKLRRRLVAFPDEWFVPMLTKIDDLPF